MRPFVGRPSRTVRAAGDSQTVLGPVLPSLGKRWPSRKSCHRRVTVPLFREPVRASSLTAAARTLPSCLASALPSRRISFRTGTARVRVAGAAGCSGRGCCLPDDSQAFWPLAGSPTGPAPPGLRRTGSTGQWHFVIGATFRELDLACQGIPGRLVVFPDEGIPFGIDLCFQGAWMIRRRTFGRRRSVERWRQSVAASFRSLRN